MSRRVSIILSALAAYLVIAFVFAGDAAHGVRADEFSSAGYGDRSARSGDEPSEDGIAEYRSICCAGIAAPSGEGYVAPVSVRTLLHNMRPACRHASCGFMARAIDSSLASERYGLYNHKILFASRSVERYLHRLCRLVI